MNKPYNMLNASENIPFSRDELGKLVREAWVRWAKSQDNPKPSWLVPYDGLSEEDKEADRQIGETIAKWTMIGIASRASLPPHSLLEWRKRLDIRSRAEAARRLGLSRNTYAAYEEGRAEIPLYVALACAALAYGPPPLQ
jgi:DNA-binding XRE family transcriptional regulator